MRTTLLLASLLLASTTPTIAQTSHGTMPMNNTPAAEPSMMASMNQMNQAMSSAPMTGNPDHDFASMMIPHHQGAIDMAKFELQHGTDPEMRKLARDVVAAQEKEISFMKRWLDKHPAK